MTINTDKVSREAVDKVNDKIKNLNKLNIIVAGKPGVGSYRRYKCSYNSCSD